MATDNLDLLSDVAGTIVVGGITHNVLALDGNGWRLVEKLAGAESALPSYELAARLVPSLGEKVHELHAVKIGRIIAVSQQPVTQVEALFPNSAGPTETDPPAPA